ncbi:hypothetical protein B0A50_04241 [Salinomyces thailandicus]|uniref:Uncharacterized protein n=1 Tax=Salinomyces thailandicus TaxID=706561 RepID=A0A4U0TYE1_9PEZI|nr:hypothetical protein B0A50_04241 [Salinomyces thailandica]
MRRCASLRRYITEQGIIQHEQSSPHQQGSLTGGLASEEVLATDEEVEVLEEEEVAETVEGGMSQYQP